MSGSTRTWSLGTTSWDLVSEAFQDGIRGLPGTKSLLRLSSRKEGEESSTTNPDNWISGSELQQRCKSSSVRLKTQIQRKCHTIQGLFLEN